MSNVRQSVQWIDSVTWPSTDIDPEVSDEAVAWLDEQLGAPARHPEVDSIDADGDESDGRPVVRRRPSRFGRAMPTLVLLALFNLAVGNDELLVARVYAVAFLLLVPGAVLLASSATRPTGLALRLTLAAATSVFWLMIVVVAVDYGLPPLGVAEPLARNPLLVSVNLLLVLTIVGVARRCDPLVHLFGSQSPRIGAVVASAALAFLPALAAAGGQSLHHGNGATMATVAVASAGALLIGMVLLADRLPSWFALAALYAAAVTTIYSFTFSGDGLFGWDIQQEFEAFAATMRANAWHEGVGQDPYRAMLSITALPTALARLTGMSGVSLLRGVYPLLFATLPVLVAVVARRWLSHTAAVAAAAFVIAQLAFAQQLPAIARQEVALMFFGVLVAIAYDDELPIGYRRVVVMAAGSALAVTHYSTAYVTSFVLLGGWFASMMVRWFGRRSNHSRVLVLPVVLVVFGMTALWNFGVTRSADNVTQFADQVAERGPEFLPSGEGRSVLDRWLTGNSPTGISGEEYAERIELIYEQGAPWLNGYSSIDVAADPVVSARSPTLLGVLPSLRTVHARSLVVASQGFVFLTSVGVLVVAWRRRRRQSSIRELALLGVAMLGFLALMRVSGVAAEAYNQERAQIHAAVVLSVGFAAVLSWFLSRWRRTSLVAIGTALAVVFLASSGLAATIAGGPAPANLAAVGDARERFAVSDAEVATADWLAANRNPDSLVYTDRYGKLRIWAAAVAIPSSSLHDDLTPATLERNSYVYASESNIVGGRARGAIGAEFAVYEFPRPFLDKHKAAIYSTGTTVIYR